MHEADHDECQVVRGDPLLEGALATVLPPLDRPSGELPRVASAAVHDRTRFVGLHVQGKHVAGFLEKTSGSPGPIHAGLHRTCRERVHNRALGGDHSDIGVPSDYDRVLRRYDALS